MIFVAGTNKMAFTVGIGMCRERKMHLPFLAFAPSERVEFELNLNDPASIMDTAESVQKTIEVFSNHGAVVFFDNRMAAENMLDMIDMVLATARQTNWYDRTPEPVRAN
jgi:hypothetical protein